MRDHSIHIAIGGAVLLVAYFLYRQQSTINAGMANNDNPVSPLPAALQQTTPGALVQVAPIQQVQPQNPAFQQFNIQIQNPNLMSLSSQYMPLFGFVGVAA
jgi:hypothetical protein